MGNWRCLARMALGIGLVSVLGLSAVPARGDDRAIELFNGKDLSGWYTFITHKDGADARTDPKGIFKVEDGVIHVSGEEFGCLITEKEFENYRLIVEFKWGTKKWPP